MPNTDLTTRPKVAKIKLSPGKTTFYSDPSIKRDPDARGIRLAVGSTKKTWMLTKRIDGKVRNITLGSWPEMPTVFAARDKAKEAKQAVAARTDAQSTGIHTLNDALSSHIARSSASERTKQGYRDQVHNNMADLFERKIEDITIDDLERVLRGHGIATQKQLAQIIRTSFKRAAVVRRCFNVADDLKVDTKGHQPDNSVRFETDERWPALDLIDAKRENNLILAAAFELMLFTGLRAGNAITLRWENVDFEAGKLRIAKLKNGRAGVFPLADRVVALLASLPQHSDWVFPQHDISKHVFHPNRLEDGDLVLRPHDCRRLFTTAARRAELPAYIIDQLRGDVEKGVQGIYDQGSTSHRHANAIAKQIEVECRELPTSNVVHIAAKR